MLYFTVITNNYLPYARVLMNQLAKLDPHADRMVFLVDNLDPSRRLESGDFDVIEFESYVAEPDRSSLVFQYNAFELCNVLKAFAHKYVYSQTKHPEWMYFDSDVFPLTECRSLMDEDPDSFLFLTPHLLTPTRISDALLMDTTILKYGVFNGGWLGLRRSSCTGDFIDWFVDRAKLLFFDEYRDTFVDQLWLNLVPVIFPGVHIVRHPGANVGYWNLHERDLQVNADGEITCQGFPLIFLHFSGWSPESPNLVTKRFPSIQANAAWTLAATEFSHLLADAGSLNTENQPYMWGHFRDGSAIELFHRRRFFELHLHRQWPENLDPFQKPRLLMRPKLPLRVARRVASRLKINLG